MSSFLFLLLTGFAYGMLYFMIAAGLTIILGVMNVFNLAHGSFYLIGAYVSFALVSKQASFWLALLFSIVFTILLGMMMELFLIKQFYGKTLEQVLLTFGLIYVVSDTAKLIWGAQMKTLPVPALFDFSIPLGNIAFPAYRLFIVLVGCLLAVLLWYFESRTRIGAIIRAGVDDRSMVSALGINVGRVFTGVFAFGAGLAALSGGLGAPLTGIYSGLDTEILVMSLIVIVIGGLGSWKGSLIGALIIGVIETVGAAWFPAISMLLIFLLMMFVLIIRPNGLFGREVL